MREESTVHSTYHLVHYMSYTGLSRLYAQCATFSGANFEILGNPFILCPRRAGPPSINRENARDERARPTSDDAVLHRQLRGARGAEAAGLRRRLRRLERRHTPLHHARRVSEGGGFQGHKCVAC